MAKLHVSGFAICFSLTLLPTNSPGDSPSTGIVKVTGPKGIPKDPITALAFSNDDNSLLTGHFSGTVSVIDPFTGTIRNRMALYSGVVGAISLSPTRPWIACTGYDKSVIVWDLHSREKIVVLNGHKADVTSVCFSPTATDLASSSKDGTIRIWDVSSWKEVNAFARRNVGSRGVSFSADSKAIVSVWDDGQVILIEARTGKQRTLFDLSGSSFLTFLDRPATSALLAYAKKPLAENKPVADVTSVVLYDCDQCRSIQEINVPGRLRSIGLSADGRLLASASVTGDASGSMIGLWEVATGKHILLRMDGASRHGKAIVAFAHNSRYIATCVDNANVKIRDLSKWYTSESVAVQDSTNSTVQHTWDSLGSSDALVAHRAIWDLVSRPAFAIGLIRSKLTFAYNAGRIDSLVRELDSDSFAVRENASKQLRFIAQCIEGRLQRKLNDPSCSVEQRRRINAIVDWAKSREFIVVRALSILEYIGSVASIELITELSKGEPDAFLTKEAVSVLRRCKSRPGSAPGLQGS